MQLARATLALATGELVDLRLVRRIGDEDLPPGRSRPLDIGNRTLERVRAAMVDVAADPLEAADRADDEPETVARMRSTLEAWPIGDGVHGSLLWALWDPDRFGGPEDREPWADVAR